VAGTVTTDFVFFTGATGGSISNCDQSTDWITAPTFDAETFVQGAGSLSAKVSATTYTSVFTFSAPVDLSDKLLVVWMNCATPNKLAAKAAGGLRLKILDASANWAEWYVAGNDTYFGGWKAFVIRTNQTPSATSVTLPTYSAITKAGVVITTTSSVAKTNFWFDAMRYGTYMQVYAGTSGSPATWDDFITYEASNAVGMLSREEGILFVQSKILVGSMGAGVATYFKDMSEIVVFRNNVFGTGFYELKGQGNSTADTEIYFGTKAGIAGISGGAIKSAGASKAILDMDDQYITKLGLYGVSFYSLDSTYLPTSSSYREVLNCSFELCKEVQVSTCTVTSCNFISSYDVGDASGAILVDSTSFGVTGCSFIACPNGVHINTPGTYGFTGMLFTECTADISNDSGGLVTINKTSPSNPSTENDDPYYGTNLKALAYDYNGGVGSVYTDQSTAAQNTTINDMALLSDSDEVGDAYYFGHATAPFASLNVDIGTSGVGTWTVTWEYWDGDSWGALSGVSDGTSGFTAATGWRAVTFTEPSDWASTTVNSVAAYWVRARMSSFASKTTAPLGDQAELVGDTKFEGSVNMLVTVLNEAGSPISGAQVAIYRTTDKEELMNKDTDVDGKAMESVAFSSEFSVGIRVRKSTSGYTRYVNASSPGTVYSSGLSATITMITELVALS